MWQGARAAMAEQKHLCEITGHSVTASPKFVDSRKSWKGGRFNKFDGGRQLMRKGKE